MNRVIFCFCFLCCFVGSALADRISATIAVTNAPTTNGMQIVITTSGASTRTWTSVVATASSQIATNATAAGSATNLFTQLVNYPPARAIPRMTSATNIVLDADNGVNLTVSFSVPAGPGYASVTYSTQTVGTAYSVRVPNTVEAATMRTNVATGIVDWANLDAATNQLKQSAPAMAQLLGTTNNQTITGNKTFKGTNALGYISAGTNGVLQSTALVNPGITNATSISGNLDLMTNGTLRTPIAIDPILTNGVNYGLPFRSPGSGADSEQFGTSSSAPGDGALALGYTATASGTLSMSFGYSSQGLGEGSIAIGPGSYANGTNATALGYAASASTFNYATALGYLATATASNQIRLGRSSDYISIPGSLTVNGRITNAAFAGTNTFPAGSDIAFGRYAITSLGNGPNSIVLGTNVFCEISGNTAAASVVGMSAAPNRDGAVRLVLYQQTYTMTFANESGLEATAANRIRTLVGADVSSAGACVARFIYSSAVSRWIMENLWSVEAGVSASTSTNIAAYQAYIATNNYASIVTNIVTSIGDSLTNSAASLSPNFALDANGKTRYAWLTTNASFVFLAPSGVDTTKTLAQTTVIGVTNSSGSTINVTFPASMSAQGTANVTNGGVSMFTFFNYGGYLTNVIALPLR
jgi:hypothetical protein